MIDKLKKYWWIATTLGTVIGFILGTLNEQQKIGNKVDLVKDKVEFLKGELKDLKDNELYQIKQWINKAR